MKSSPGPGFVERIESRLLLAAAPAAGGTAVYDAPGRSALDPAGNVLTLPSADALRDWLTGHAVRFSEHGG
jgi:hypothetical protein